mgnify:CR=1 FL=1
MFFITKIKLHNPSTPSSHSLRDPAMSYDLPRHWLLRSSSAIQELLRSHGFFHRYSLLPRMLPAQDFPLSVWESCLLSEIPCLLAISFRLIGSPVLFTARSSINLNAYLPFVDTFIIYSFPIKFVIKKTNLHCKIIIFSIFLYSYYVNRN